VRIVIATCTVDYSGRLSAHLDPAKRVIMLKGDGSVLIHSEGGSYKPLNWMTAPCTVSMGEPGEDEEGVEQVWTVQADKTDDKLIIRIHDAIADVGAVEQRHDDGLRTDDGSQLLHGRLQVVTLRAAEDVIGREAELLRLFYDALRTHAKRLLRGLHLQPVPSNLQPVLSSGDEIHLNLSVGCICARQHAAKISADASYTCDYNSLHNK